MPSPHPPCNTELDHIGGHAVCLCRCMKHNHIRTQESSFVGPSIRILYRVHVELYRGSVQQRADCLLVKIRVNRSSRLSYCTDHHYATASAWCATAMQRATMCVAHPSYLDCNGLSEALKTNGSIMAGPPKQVPWSSVPGLLTGAHQFQPWTMWLEHEQTGTRAVPEVLHPALC